MAISDKEFIVVAGKGGTGRTTTALVIGHYLAANGRRTLVCLANALPRYLDILGEVPIGSSIRSVFPFLDVVNLEPRASQEEYGLRVLRNRALHRIVFGSKIVRGFLDAVPGLAEWAMLGKATHHALNRPGGIPEYDTVVLDSSATGHGLDVLALPRAIVSAVPTGRMREEALLRCALMEDPTRSEVVPVTLPEDMPVNETYEFVRALKKIGMSVERIVVNRVTSKDLGEKLKELIEDPLNRSFPKPWLLPAAVVLAEMKSQQRSLKRLGSLIPAPQITLPDLIGDGLDEGTLPVLIEAFQDGMDRSSSDASKTLSE